MKRPLTRVTTSRLKGGVWHEADGALIWTSHQELRRQAWAVVSVLADSGVAAGDRVVVVSEPRPEVLVVDLAAAELGACLEVIEPSASAGAASELIRRCEPHVVFCHYPEQAAIVDGLCSAVIVTFEGRTPFTSWSDAIAAANLPVNDNGSAADPGTAVRATGSTHGASVRNEVVVCTAEMSRPAARAWVHSALASGAAVVLSQPAEARRLHRRFDPDGIVVPERVLREAYAELSERAPRDTRWRDVIGEVLVVAAPALWGALSLGEVASSTGGAWVAMALTCVVLGAASLVDRGSRTLLAVLAACAAVAFALRIADAAPSVVAALELLVVAALAARVLRCSLRWLASAVWRQGTGSAGAEVSTAAAPRIRWTVTRMASRAVERAARDVLGLHSCRRAVLAGMQPDSADRFRRMFGSLEITALLDADAVARGPLVRGDGQHAPPPAAPLTVSR